MWCDVKLLKIVNKTGWPIQNKGVYRLWECGCLKLIRYVFKTFCCVIIYIYSIRMKVSIDNKVIKLSTCHCHSMSLLVLFEKSFRWGTYTVSYYT